MPEVYPTPRRSLRFSLAVGQVVGHRTIIGECVLIFKGGKLRPHYLCRCECGREMFVVAQALRKGIANACRGRRMPDASLGTLPCRAVLLLVSGLLMRT